MTDFARVLSLPDGTQGLCWFEPEGGNVTIRYVFDAGFAQLVIKIEDIPLSLEKQQRYLDGLTPEAMLKLKTNTLDRREH